MYKCYLLFTICNNKCLAIIITLSQVVKYAMSILTQTMTVQIQLVVNCLRCNVTCTLKLSFVTAIYVIMDNYGKHVKTIFCF